MPPFSNERKSLKSFSPLSQKLFSVALLRIPKTKIFCIYLLMHCHFAKFFLSCPKLHLFLFCALHFFRWKLLQLGLDEHYKKLNEFRNRDVPTTQDFLSVAVHYPWARAISQNKVPYYIK